MFGGKPPSMKERAREWSTSLKKEIRTLDRDINKMEREEAKVKLEVKKAAQKGQKQVAVTLAKALVKSQKARDRLLEAKVRTNSVLLNIKTQVASIAVAEAYQKSSQIMKGMQSLIKIPQLAKVAQDMSKEMMKAGIIEEMVDEAMESVDGEDIEEQAQDEVDAVLYDITKGQLGVLPDVSKRPIKVAAAAEVKQEEKVKESEKEAAAMDHMKLRLQNL